MIKVKTATTTTKEITEIYVKTGASTTKSIGEVYQVYSSGGTKALVKVFGAVLGVQAPTVSSVIDDGETVYVTAVAKNANDTIEYRFTEYSIEGTCSYESDWSQLSTLIMYSCTNEVCVEVRSVRNNETSEIVTINHYPDREAYHDMTGWHFIGENIYSHAPACSNGNCGYVDYSDTWDCNLEVITEATCDSDGLERCTECGSEYIVPAGHYNYRYDYVGDGMHHVYCADCGELLQEYASCNYSNGSCPYCGSDV